MSGASRDVQGIVIRDHVLVTGGCGFIGANLIPNLPEQGARVRVLDNLSRVSRSNLAGLDVAVVEAERHAGRDARTGARRHRHGRAPRSSSATERRHATSSTSTTCAKASLPQSPRR